jgi:Domain of unknown function (DUF892)
MTTTARDVFMVGLRNAHSMEVQAREMMERQSERLSDYPDVQARVKEHLAETNEQLRRLDQCLEACGETSSTLKDTAQSVMGNTMAMAHAMAGDEILKSTFANNAFEHFGRSGEGPPAAGSKSRGRRANGRVDRRPCRQGNAGLSCNGAAQGRLARTKNSTPVARLKVLAATNVLQERSASEAVDAAERADVSLL